MNWVPSRQDVIWIDCNPQAGQEMQNVHPFVVISPQEFNDKTSLVIGLPMTTAAYNASNPFALNVGEIQVKKTMKQSYILCHQPKSFDWRARGASAHPMKKLAKTKFIKMCGMLNQIVDI